LYYYFSKIIIEFGVLVCTIRCRSLRTLVGCSTTTVNARQAWAGRVKGLLYGIATNIYYS